MSSKASRRAAKRAEKRQTSLLTRATGKAPAHTIATFGPKTVHTHEKQPTQPISRFKEFLLRTPVLCTVNSDARAYAMADYCNQGIIMLARVINTLDNSHKAQASSALTDEEQTLMKSLRARWLDHVRTHIYELWNPPPSSGGRTARYSLAFQVWLLVLHADVVLQMTDAVSDLFAFYPPASNYLSRNNLIVDNAAVMQYPLRTFMIATELFVYRLDSIDRYARDYMRYAMALEHRFAELVCRQGELYRDYNAREWCYTDPETKKERVTDQCIQYTMVRMLTIYSYAENYCSLHITRVLRDNNEWESVVARVSIRQVQESDWVPSMRSITRILDFFCQTTLALVDDNYTSALRAFLLAFELRSSDMDVYRLLNNNNAPFQHSVLQFQFEGASKIARAYTNKVYYERPPYLYMTELIQWERGNPETTRSAALDRQQLVRELAFLYAVHQYIESRFHIPWRNWFLLFHRATDFLKQLDEARGKRFPIIVQQFARFAVFVPHCKDPRIDAAEVVQWRAASRAHRKGLPPVVVEPHVPYKGLPPREHARAYDCNTAVDAVALWALWTLQLTDGKLDRNINLRQFLQDLLGWQRINVAVQTVS